MAIRYAIDLTDTERAVLREIISKNKAKRSTIINAYVLLKADRSCGWTNEAIAAAYEVSSPPYSLFRLNGDMKLNRNRQLFV
jgi:hypothetical protein